MGRHEYTTEMRSEPASAKKQSKVFWDRVGDHIRSTEVPASLATINCLIHFKISLTGPQSVKSWRLINTEYVLQHYRFPLSAHWRLAIRAVCTSSAKKENHSLLAVENVFFSAFHKKFECAAFRWSWNQKAFLEPNSLHVLGFVSQKTFWR